MTREETCRLFRGVVSQYLKGNPVVFARYEAHVERCPVCSELVARHNADNPPQLFEAQIEVPRIPGYEIVELLGEGGMGTVYRARSQSLNRVEAVKVIRAGMDTAVQRQRFLSEARTVAKLSHPHIVQVYAVS